jgi:acetylornithine deacetylase/succinyl-diaminopimelate desuccinylase-like protein
VLARAEYVITAGGENVADAGGKPQYFGLETGEKGPFWLTLRTTGQPGHGSRPIADSAVNRLVRALDRIQAYRPALVVLPTVERFFQDQAPRAGARAEWYRDMRAALQDPATARVLQEDREVAPLLQNTIAITILRAGYKTNVIPGTAEAELDVRLLPGQDPQAFLAELRQVIADPGVEIVAPPSFRPPNESPADGALFQTVQSVLAEHYPGVPVSPKMLTGATESVLFRAAGAKAYGFTPLVLSQAELDSQHGDNERINEEALRAAVPVFYEVVRDLSVPGGGGAARQRPARAGAPDRQR